MIRDMSKRKQRRTRDPQGRDTQGRDTQGLDTQGRAANVVTTASQAELNSDAKDAGTNTGAGASDTEPSSERHTLPGHWLGVIVAGSLWLGWFSYLVFVAVTRR